MASGIGPLFLLLIVPGLLLIVALVIAVLLRSSKGENAGAAPETDGPGRYRIAGSSGDGSQIQTVIEAQSWADACRQAEDRGIEVTVVQRLVG